ncbi:LPXTG cell wall anchor domain-containing protein [Microbacterium sp. CFBP 13617]|uniref:LPXTG cell wall anchor domain-containing protein n=1 Tax=Microbacterium sp. CFBP 13617 TaxID=2774035 RepID=UPI00177C049A|nr:LPXTG cell wall anchor domain-containing protein [Microbacterium sp. CFBP 13617]MBD8218535.1 LPXTG cell wall anchor domain-containing protein [Microbacterium sp. CFBP 13617]
MKHLTKAAASAAIAGALLLAAPAVAQAYVPAGPDTQTFTITSNGPVPVSGFTPGAETTFTLVGVGVTGANIATANLPVSSASVTKTADASGVATATVTLPANPVGTYTLAVTGARAANNGGGSGSGTGGGSFNNGSNALPATGMDADSLLGIWVGGGALVLAGAAVAVGAKVRRTRQENHS